MRHQPASPDQVVAQIAARHHGVVSSRQLLSAGLTKSGIARRRRAGRLHLIHRGVYAVGHKALTHEGKCMAAALAYGESAAISHRSAATLWGLLPPGDEVIQVTLLGLGAGAAEREPVFTALGR